MSTLVNITLTSANGLIAKADTLELGKQYENNAALLRFSRPEELAGYSLNLIFWTSFNQRAFAPMPVFNDEFMVTSILTQGERLSMQAVLTKGEEEIRANVLEFTLTPSIAAFEQPPLELPTLAGASLSMIASTQGQRTAFSLTPFGLQVDGEPVVTKKALDKAIAEAIKADLTPAMTQGVIDLLYPVGSIYTSVKDADPATFLPGTVWKPFAQGRTLFGVAADADHPFFGGPVERQGGEEQVALATKHLPAHAHKTALSVEAISVDLDGGSTPTELARLKNEQGVTEVAGKGAAHNNLPPYVTVYFWKREA